MTQKRKFICLAFLISFLPKGDCQIDYNNVPQVTKTILINDIHVQVDPNTLLGLSDILIENGLISKIAPYIEPPFNAQIIEADSAYAYPGFIDAFSHVGIPKEDDKKSRPEVQFKGYPPNDVAGITPEVTVSTQIDHKHSSFKKYRDAGFTIVHSVPKGRMLPGQGVILSLNNTDNENMVIRDNASTLFQFKGARGFYPNTSIGVMAKWRDLYKNAELLDKNNKAYALSPKGLMRPQNDKAISALIPVTHQLQPVFTPTKKSKDIFRAVALQKELGYKLVLSNVEHIGASQKHLNSSDIDIILSLNLPKKNKEGKPLDSLNLNNTQKALMARKKNSIKEYLTQAGNLEKMGKSFSFTVMDSKIDELKRNLLRLIENGLTEKAALSALTINPAQLLNIDKITGTLEKGKLANISIYDKPFFQKDSKIKMVIVEGNVNEVKQSSDKKQNSNNKNLLGVWSYTSEILGEDYSGTVTIEDNDGSLSVVILNDDEPDKPLEGQGTSYENGKLSYSITIISDGQVVPVNINMDMAEDSYSGNINIEGLGDFSMEGKKITSPENK